MASVGRSVCRLVVVTYTSDIESRFITDKVSCLMASHNLTSGSTCTLRCEGVSSSGHPTGNSQSSRVSLCAQRYLRNLQAWTN